jgi:DNA-binding IclR family transcriptional regulator
MRDTTTGGHAPGATRALAVLSLLAASGEPLPAAAIARRLGLPRSTTYHLLAAMAEQAFVVHLPEEQRWGLGVAAFEVGSAYLRQDALTRLATPLLGRLADDVGAAAQLAILHGRETLYLVKIQPAGSVGVVTDVGVRLPAHLTASGKALLARLPAAQVRALLPSASAFVDRTGRGARSLSELRRQLRAERAQGYATEDGFVTPGMASIAVASIDHTGLPVAAVAVTFSRTDCPPARWPTVAQRVRRAADALSRRLGGTPEGTSA